MKRLNYHHLYYFWRIAIAGKLTDVAKDMHISQSALSAQIKQLEEQVGIPLFTRQNRKLVLTDTGKKVLDYAEDIFSTGEELEHLIQQGFRPDTQHLSIGVLNNLSRNFVESFISPLLEQQDITFTLETRRLEDIVKGLTNHQFDLALTNCAIASFDSNKLWKTQLVTQQPIAIVGAADNKPEHDFPNGYGNKEWVLPSQTTEMRSAFESWCAIKGYRANVKAEANDMAMLRLLARDSRAVSVLPPVVVKDEIEQGLLCIYEYIPNAFENFYAISASKKNTPAIITHLIASALEAP